MRTELSAMFLTLVVVAVFTACGSDDGSEQKVKDTTCLDDVGVDGESDDLASNGDADTAGQELADEVVDPVESVLAAPAGVAVVDGRVFVVNSNGAWNNELFTMEYGPGTMTVLDADTLERVGHVDLGCTNPQYLAGHEGKLLVVCSGTVVSDENWVMTPATAGKLVQVDAGTLKVEASVELPNGQPKPMAGFPGSVCVSAEAGRVFVGSGTGPYLYIADLANIEEGLLTQELYSMEGGNDSLTVECSGGKVYAASFNTGSLFVVDGSDLTSSEPVQVTQTQELEGPVDMLFDSGKLYVLNTISSQVAILDTLSLQVTFPVVTGAAPNRLGILDKTLFVVNSTDNNLTKFDVTTGQTTTPFGAMDVGTNPWEIAIAGNYGYITGYVANTVIKMDMGTGEIAVQVGNQ